MLTLTQNTATALPFVPNPMGDGYAPLSLHSGKAMIRACKPRRLVYKGVDQTYLQPGWYDLETGFTVFTEADGEVEKRMAALLRRRVDGEAVA